MSFSADLKTTFIKAQNLVPQHQLSRVIAKLQQVKTFCETAVIQAFKAKYGIDMSIAEQTNRININHLMNFSPVH